MTWLPSQHRRIAATFEDLAARLDAGLLPGATAGETAAAWIRHAPIRVASYELRSIEAAESVGRGPEILRRLATGRQELAAAAQKMIDSVAYPCTVLVVAGAVASLLMVLGLPLPHGWLLTVGIVATTVGILGAWLVRRLRDPGFAPDRLPLVGSAARVASELPYLTALSLLYGAGVPLRTAHRDALPAARGAWVRARLAAAAPALDRGDGFASSLASQGALTAETLQLVTEGERIGGLEDALRRAIERRRMDLLTWLNRAARIVGVIAYLAAAGSVLWIAASFYGGLFARLSP